MLKEYLPRIEFLRTHRYQDLLSKLEIVAHKSLSTHMHKLGNGTKKAIILDLCYIYFRHESLIHAPTLAEFTIDYINSEFGVPRGPACELVEACIEFLMEYIPADRSWSAEDYDREFLFQLFISSANSKSELELRNETGFGSNVLKLLHSAVSLDDSGASQIFAPELTQSLFQMMQEISKEMAETPWILDMYRLKSLLEAHTSHKPSKVNKHELEQYFEVLVQIAWDEYDLKSLQKLVRTSDLKKTIEILKLSDLIYLQIKGRQKIFKLSHKGIDIISEKMLSQIGDHHMDALVGAPDAFQAKVLECEATNIQDVLDTAGTYFHSLGPKGISALLDRIAKENPKSIDLVLQNSKLRLMNSWAKSALCHGLRQFKDSSEAFQALIYFQNEDSSPKVREEARQSVLVWRKKNTTFRGIKDNECDQ